MTDLAALLPPEAECSACHQTDNHPKHHYGEDRYHFDCLPDDVRADSFDHLPPEERQRIDTVIAHALGTDADHLHGDDLRAKHVELDPNQPDHVKQAFGVKAPTSKGKSNG